jgi:hypothetical protein
MTKQSKKSSGEQNKHEQVPTGMEARVSISAAPAAAVDSATAYLQEVSALQNAMSMLSVPIDLSKFFQDFVKFTKQFSLYYHFC